MSKFVMQSEMTTDHVDWGSIGWRTRPENTACTTFVVMDVGLEPGFGHDFHKHPEQDELITVLALLLALAVVVVVIADVDLDEIDLPVELARTLGVVGRNGHAVEDTRHRRGRNARLRCYLVDRHHDDLL